MLQIIYELGSGMKLGSFGYKLKSDNILPGTPLCLVSYCHGVSSFRHRVSQDGILTGHHTPRAMEPTDYQLKYPKLQVTINCSPFKVVYLQYTVIVTTIELTLVFLFTCLLEIVYYMI